VVSYISSMLPFSYVQVNVRFFRCRRAIPFVYYLLLGQLEKTVREGMCTSRMASFFIREAMAKICDRQTKWISEGYEVKEGQHMCDKGMGSRR